MDNAANLKQVNPRGRNMRPGNFKNHCSSEHLVLDHVSEIVAVISYLVMFESFWYARFRLEDVAFRIGSDDPVEWGVR